MENTGFAFKHTVFVKLFNAYFAVFKINFTDAVSQSVFKFALKINLSVFKKFLYNSVGHCARVFFNIQVFVQSFLINFFVVYIISAHKTDVQGVV